MKNNSKCMSGGANPSSQGRSRPGNIHLKTISSCPLSHLLGYQPRKCSPPPLRQNLSLARSSPVRRDWLASEPRGSSCFHIPALGLQMCAARLTSLCGFWNSSPQVLLTIFSDPLNTFLIKERYQASCRQLASRDPLPWTPYPFPHNVNLMCMGWGGTCGDEENEGPVAT